MCIKLVGMSEGVRRALLAGLCLAAVSCSDSPSAPSAAQIAGTWNVVTVRATGGSDQARPAGAQYHMTIDNGRVSLRVDCNTCTGNATQSSTTLSLGPMACTRAFCATAAFETTITSILSGDHTAAIRGNTLTLTSSRGVVRFER